MPKTLELSPTDQPEPEAPEYLEDEVQPPEAVAPPPLSPGDKVHSPDLEIEIRQVQGSIGTVNLYLAEASPMGSAAESSEAVLLREAWVGPFDAPLRRQAQVLEQVRYPMLPQLRGLFESEGRLYLVTDTTDAPTLAEVLQHGTSAEAQPDLAELIGYLVQAAQALRKVQRGGWAVLGLTPATLALSRPVRFLDLSWAAPIGAELPATFSIPGYSAPELAVPGKITGREDVYSLGAILFHILAGRPLSEEGEERSDLSSHMHVPGGPQLLDPALAPADERTDLESLYQSLTGFKARLEPCPAVEIGAATTVGLNPTRLINEDAFAWVSHTRRADASRTTLGNSEDMTHPTQAVETHIVCISDGMGGMDAGEVAARAAVDGACLAALNWLAGQEGPSNLSELARRLVQEANTAMVQATVGKHAGATFTAVVIDGRTLAVGHVGDSRAYLVRGGQSQPLTHDHSLVGAMVRAKEITEAEALTHPDRNKVFRSLGRPGGLPDDYVDDLRPALGQLTLTLQSGDTVILCTDGVWSELPEPELTELAASPLSPNDAAQAMVERVLQGGAPDNATVVVIRIRERK